MASKGGLSGGHHLSACIACAAPAGLVDYVVEPGTSAEERGMVLARDIAQARTTLTSMAMPDWSTYSLALACW